MKSNDTIAFDNIGAARLALRHEGDFWNVYVAEVDTMDGAVFLGSIRMAAVVDNNRRKEAFKAIMNDFFKEIINEYYETQGITYEERLAPEHEKAGHS